MAQNPHDSFAHRALEMTMRDTLGGLEELATYFAYRSTPDTLEILSIDPPGDDPHAPTGERRRAPVVAGPGQRSDDIVAYLIARESRDCA